ncbi:hypothetical protein [Thermococcus litoralis]|nr:hypothetical protein [Thermococcus litoralis]
MVKRELKVQYPDLVLIILFLLLSLSIEQWFGGLFYIHQIDSSFYLNPTKRLTDVTYIWKDQNSLGYSMAEFNLIPFYAFQIGLLRTLEFIGFDSWRSLVYSQMIIYYLTVFMSFSFSYMFFKKIYELYNRKDITVKRYLVPAMVSIFYVINPHTISVVFWRYMSWSRFWFGAPLLGYIFIRYLETKHMKYILISALLFFTPLASGFSVVGFLLLYSLWAILGIVYNVLSQEHPFKTFRHLVTFIAMFTFQIMWILLPLYFSLTHTYQYAISLSSATPEDMLKYSSKFTTVINIFRLMGNHLLYSTYEDGYPYVWVESYLHGIPSVLILLFVIIIMLPLLTFKMAEKRKISAYLAIISIWTLLVIVMKGMAPPMQYIGKSLLKLNPAFFRHPYDRFISLYVILFGILLVFSFSELLSRVALTSKRVLSLFMLFMICIYAIGYPFFNGDIIPPQDRITLRGTEYDKLGNLTLEGSLLIMPFSLYREYSYNISGRINHPNAKSIAYAFVSSKPVYTTIRYASSEQDKIFLDYLYSYIISNNSVAFINMLIKFGFKYILLQKDFSSRYLNTDYATAAKKMTSFLLQLNRSKLIVPVLNTKDFTLFKIPTNNVTNRINVGRVSLLSEHSLFNIPPQSVNFVCFPHTYQHPLKLLSMSNIILLRESKPINIFTCVANSTFISPLSFSSQGWKKIAYGVEKIAYSDTTYFIPNSFNMSQFKERYEVLRMDFESPKEYAQRKTGVYTLSLSTDAISGNYSLNISTCTNKKRWSYVSSPEINVTPGEVLLVHTATKVYNLQRVHVAIAGYSNITHKWEYLEFAPPGTDGFTPWKSHIRILQVPENITKIKLVLNAGWVYNTTTDRCGYALFDDIWIYNITGSLPRTKLIGRIDIKESQNYHLIIRYFKNQKGGAIRVYLDGTPIYIRTKDQLNKFVWEDLGTFNLEKGEHKIVLENVRGFNAVNLFALIPENEYNKARKEAIELLQNKTIIYLFEAESDLYRENVEIIKDFNASNGEAIKFNQKGKAWQNVEIVKNSTYRLALKGNGTFNISIGDYKYVLTVNNSTFEYTPLFYLRNGEYKLEITPTSKDALLDVVWLYSTDKNETLEELFQTNETPATVQNYTKINPTLWKVKVNATKPFFLTFAESYDPLWEARVYKNGKLVEKVSPVPVYGVINGFWINQTGNLEIVLRYTPQDWFERGLIISLTTFILSVFYIFYDWRREKGDKWAKRLERKAKKFLDKLKQRIRFKNLRKLFM